MRATFTVCVNYVALIMDHDNTGESEEALQASLYESTGLYSVTSLDVLNNIEKVMEIIIHFLQNRYSQFESPCAACMKQPVRDMLECLSSSQAVLLPLIHFVLDFL